MSPAEWIAVVGAAAWLPGIWGIVQAWKKRRESAAHAADEGDRMVVKSALELLQPYKARVAELESQLRTAESTIKDMNASLTAANEQVGSLTSRLNDAQTEMNFLRLQVKALSQQLPSNP